MNRQVEILGCRPKPFIVIRGKRQSSDGAPAKSWCRPSPLFAALHFGDGMIDIEHGDQRDAKESIRNFLTVVRSAQSL